MFVKFWESENWFADIFAIWGEWKYVTFPSLIFKQVNRVVFYKLLIHTIKLKDLLNFMLEILIICTSDVTAEAPTQDLFGWKQKRKQLKQTASTSRYYTDHSVL